MIEQILSFSILCSALLVPFLMWAWDDNARTKYSFANDAAMKTGAMQWFDSNGKEWIMNNPNWFRAMVKHSWTVRNISREFQCSKLIAAQIQHCARHSYKDAMAIAQVSRELCNQVGA
jgi:hypothetical protein